MDALPCPTAPCLERIYGNSLKVKNDRPHPDLLYVGLQAEQQAGEAVDLRSSLHHIGNARAASCDVCSVKESGNVVELPRCTMKI